jgi:hypothetical protein
MTAREPQMIECGFPDNRLFDTVLSAAVGVLCLFVGATILRWTSAKPAVWLFTPRVDPDQRIQRAYGMLCVVVALLKLFGRHLPLGPLDLVRPAFFFTTVFLVVALGLRVLYLASAPRDLPLPQGRS